MEIIVKERYLIEFSTKTNKDMRLDCDLRK